MTVYHDIAKIDVIAPNFKRRLSGVTSTIVQLIPELQRQGVRIATLGPGLPETHPKLNWRQLTYLWRKPDGKAARIWHARRNTEMLAGVVLKYALRAPLKLVFTSAAQRRHTGYTRWLMRRMDALIATSEKSASFLDLPATVISHGVDLQAFHPPSEAEADWRNSGLPGNYGIGCFGRVRLSKGTDLFVDAMIALLPAYPEWTAAIFGRVTSENAAFARELEARIAAANLSDRIIFMGEVPDQKPWMRRISLCVAPSRNEGFGLTPIEAMASHTAVVASDAGAYQEQVAEGETGFVVPAGNLDALKAAIVIYLANPGKIRDHGENALNRARSQYDLAREAQAIRAVYDKIWVG